MKEWRSKGCRRDREAI